MRQQSIGTSQLGCTAAIVLVLIAAVLTGCTLSVTPSTLREDAGAVEAAGAKGCQPLDADNADRAKLTATLSGPDRSKVLDIYFSLDGKELFIVHDSGYVVEWRFPYSVPIRSIATTEAAIMPIGFDPMTRELVLAVGDHMSIPDDQGAKAAFTHIEVWNLTTGDLTRRFSVGGSISSGVLAPSGRWLLTAEVPAALVLRDTTTELGGQSLLLWDDSREGVRQPFITAFDSVGEWFAFTLGNEEIGLGKVARDETLRSLGHISERGKPLALAFAPSRKHLAILGDAVLELRDLRLPFVVFNKKASLTEPVTWGMVTFAKSGSILALASDKGWEIRDAANLQLLIRTADPIVSTLGFTVDGCSLMIGRVDGTTQVWSPY